MASPTPFEAPPPTSAFARVGVATRVQNEAEAPVQQHGVQPRESITAPKTAPSMLKAAGEIISTSMHGVRLAQIPIFRYSAKITGHTSNRHLSVGAERSGVVELTRKFKDSVMALEYRTQCREVLGQLIERNKAFFQGAQPYYDLQSIISTRNFNIQVKQFELPGDLWPHWGFDKIVIELRPVTEDFQLNIGDIAAAVPLNLANMGRSPIQFRENATSRYALIQPDEHVGFPGGKTYPMDPSRYGIKEGDTPTFSKDACLAAGARSSVQPMEGPSDRGNAAIALVDESKKTPFRATKKLIEAAQNVVQNLNGVRNGELDRLNKEFKGKCRLWVTATHKTRNYKIRCITGMSALQMSFLREDNEPITVFDYFRKQYNITLEHPNAPLVESVERSHKIYLPMEVLYLMDNKVANPDPARNDTGNPRNAPYLIPASVELWGCYWICGGRSDRMQAADVKTFLDRFIEMCTSRGMRMPQPRSTGQIPTRRDKLEECMKAAKRQNLQYLLFVHSDQGEVLHDWMKKYESELQIVTQDVRVKTVMDVVAKGRPQTVESIANKANLKLGGVNYELDLDTPQAKFVQSPDMLCIGLGTDHPSGGLGMQEESDELLEGGPPSITGYAANTNASPFEFVGDFHFQERRYEEKPDVLVGIVKTCVEKFQANRLMLPKQIVLYRNVIKKEVPLIYAALQQMQCDAKVTVFVPNNVRLFKKDVPRGAKAPEQNPHRTVVDRYVVHPTHNEFYPNSHVALQGTAKTPRYTMLVDDNGFSSDKLQLMTSSWMCYDHQIVSLPTGLPSPVYIALQYAKRGRAIFNTHMSRSQSSQVSVGSPSDNWRRIENPCGFANVALGNMGVNA
ncbi:WAGO-2 protein [Aphelenchoides avenae]|nr:WAGO-2 protein [Aphelenchus avenae]